MDFVHRSATTAMISYYRIPFYTEHLAARSEELWLSIFSVWFWYRSTVLHTVRITVILLACYDHLGETAIIAPLCSGFRRIIYSEDKKRTRNNEVECNVTDWRENVYCHCVRTTGRSIQSYYLLSPTAK